jgi:hypothetical protein
MSNKQGWTQSEDLNWDEVSDGPPPPPEDGIYRVAVAKAEPSATGKGDPAVSLQLTLIAQHGSDKKVKGRLYDKPMLSGEAIFRTKQLARVAGVALPKNNGFDAVSEFANELVGCEFWVRTKQQPYDGKVNAKVDMYISDDKLEEVLNGSAGGATAEATVAPARRKRPTA